MVTPTWETGSDDGAAPIPADADPFPVGEAPFEEPFGAPLAAPADGVDSSIFVTKRGPKTTPEGISDVVTTPMAQRRGAEWEG